LDAGECTPQSSKETLEGRGHARKVKKKKRFLKKKTLLLESSARDSLFLLTQGRGTAGRKKGKVGREIERRTFWSLWEKEDLDPQGMGTLGVRRKGETRRGRAAQKMGEIAGRDELKGGKLSQEPGKGRRRRLRDRL